MMLIFDATSFYYSESSSISWIEKWSSNHSLFHSNVKNPTFSLQFLTFFSYRCSLPIPWLLYGIVFQAPVEVNSCGMVCSIAILFMMLLFVIASIACFHWRMNKGLGVTMFLLYFVFVAISLMFEYKHLTCPFWSVMTLNQKGKPIIQTNTRTHKLKHKYSTKPLQGIKYFPIDCRTE